MLEIDAVTRSSLSPEPDQSRLLRYRFDSPKELYRHARVQKGFFVPGRALLGEPNDRVMVEVEFPGAPCRPLLHGQILARSEAGVWLLVRGALTMTRWSPGPGAPDRKDRRLACDLFAELRLRGTLPWVCRVADLSAGGLRVAAAAIELGIANDELDVILLPRDSRESPASLHVRLAWAGARDAGLQILEADGALSHIVAEAQARWENVPQVVHDAECLCAAPLRRAAG